MQQIKKTVHGLLFSLENCSWIGGSDYIKVCKRHKFPAQQKMHRDGDEPIPSQLIARYALHQTTCVVELFS